MNRFLLSNGNNETVFFGLHEIDVLENQKTSAEPNLDNALDIKQEQNTVSNLFRRF